MVLTIDLYTAIINNCLSVAFIAQWVEHVNIEQLFFKLCIVSSNPVRNMHYCNYCKDFCFYFYSIFSFLQYRFSILSNLISSVTTTFSRQIRNNVHQLSPFTSSVLKICAAT